MTTLDTSGMSAHDIIGATYGAGNTRPQLRPAALSARPRVAQEVLNVVVPMCLARDGVEQVAIETSGGGLYQVAVWYDYNTWRMIFGGGVVDEEKLTEWLDHIQDWVEPEDVL